jgi:hypothetical protein
MTDRPAPHKRPAPITFRLPKGLREEFNARVAASGLSTSAYIQRAIFDTPPPRRARRRPVAEPGDLARLLSRAAEMAGHLEAIERLAAEGGQDVREPLDQAAGHLAEMRAALFHALGRSP